MNWIVGLQKSIDYIEEHLLEEIDYEEAAAQSFSSSYHFQRVFSIICGFTIGEYIRNRRLSLAGNDLAKGNMKVIDAAVKYGYESPDSFAKAFQKFHGILPSQARCSGSNLKSFSRLVLRISLEGGKTMNYRIEQKPKMILTGYKAHFTGVDFVKSLGFEHITVPESNYVIFETSDVQDPICDYFKLLNMRIQILTEWLPEMGFKLKESPELSVYHWVPKRERNVQIWLPIEKVNACVNASGDV